MAKISDQENVEKFVKLLEQINGKISNARVLNGGFDKLEAEVNEIKKAQFKLVIDSENSKENIERLEFKLDKIFDPEEGIYPKIKRTELIMENLDSKMNHLRLADDKFSEKLVKLESTVDKADKDFNQLKKITGEDHKELKKAIKLSTGLWWFVGFTTTGLLSAVGKLIWDYFTSQ